jgi:CelD/BcsL family acetyltransferase involved in cellulose biosynthesis
MHGTIDSQFWVEWRPLDQLTAVAGEWGALADRAIGSNVFYSPSFALAAAPMLGRDVGACLVWSQSPPQRLVGFFPARIEQRRYGLKLAVLVGWTHAYAPLGVPLVDPTMPAPVITAWLAHLADNRNFPDLVLMPLLPESGPLASSFKAALARVDARTASYAPHARAELIPGPDRAHYLDQAIGRRKRKELDRQYRRLAERGALQTTNTTEPKDINSAVETFLALEAGGWKGRAGTAATLDPGIRLFMQHAIVSLAATGQARIDILRIDGQPIAGTVTLISGDTAWCWKIAYDEDFARYSPGVQMIRELTQRLLSDEAIKRVDSCATADHPMIDHLWRERLALSDQLIAVRGGQTFKFAVACRLESLRRVAIAAAKALRDRVRRH